jgi:hypothetical protein
MVVEVSSGNTATPDGTWSAWAPVTSGATITAPAGRYLQYRVTFSTTDTTLTSVLKDLTVMWK